MDIIKTLYKTSPSIRKNLEAVFPKTILEKSNLLAAVAKSMTGLQVIKDDPELACVRALNIVYKIALGEELGEGSSTYRLFDLIRSKSNFCAINAPSTGCIILSPTGHGNGKVRGHVGLFINDHLIASNDSRNGIWSTHYTYQSWINRYVKTGDIPTQIYRVL